MSLQTTGQEADSSSGLGRMVGRKAGFGFGGVSGDVPSVVASSTGAGFADSSALAGFIVGRNAGLGLDITGSGGVDSGVVEGEDADISGSFDMGFGGFIVGRKPAGFATVGLGCSSGVGKTASS